MGASAGPDIVEDGLVLYLDAANERSYPGSGNTWFDLSGNGNDATIPVSFQHINKNTKAIKRNSTVLNLSPANYGLNLNNETIIFVAKCDHKRSINFGRGAIANRILNIGSYYRNNSATLGFNFGGPLFIIKGPTSSGWTSSNRLTDKRSLHSKFYDTYDYLFYCVQIVNNNRLIVSINNEKIYDYTISEGFTGYTSNKIEFGRLLEMSLSYVKLYDRLLNDTEITKNYQWFISKYNTLGTYNKPAKNALEILKYIPNSENGIYWIDTGYGKTPVFCDMENGGWMLVASNNASDTNIPSGTNRNNIEYQLNRNGAHQHLGFPNPNFDYIIGKTIDNLDFSSVKIWGFGRNSLDGSKTWEGNQGDNIIVSWNLNTTKENRFEEIVPVSSVSVSGNTLLHERANYFILDAVKNDVSLNANSNQSTIGAAGVYRSNGDPSNGTFLGHGSTEGSYEGWYVYNSSHADSQGYTTWVK